MNQIDFDKLLEIRKLLKEAYDHYFDNSDGHCKSAEGHIDLEFGNYWTDKNCEMKVTSVNIYSYVLGPTRNHSFDSIDEALETVKKWHKNEIEFDYEQSEKDEQEYWDNYYKKHPEMQRKLINPNYRYEQNS